MVIEQFKRFRKEEAEKGKPKEAEAGPTLREILADKKQSELFGLFLDKEGENELAGKLLSGELEEDDVDLLQEFRERFTGILERCEGCRELLNAETFQEMIGRSPELARIAGLVGAEGVKEVIGGQLEKVSIEDPQSFQRLETLLNGLAYHEGIMRDKDEEIKKLCVRHNVTEQELVEALKIDDPVRRRREVETIVRSGMTFGGLFRGKETKKRVAELDTREEIEKELEIIENQMGILGRRLSETISESPEVRRALATVIRSERAETREKGMGFREMRGAMASEQDLEREALEEWKRYKKRHKVQASGLGTAQANFKGEFVNRKIGKRRGFWATVAQTLLTGLFNTRINSKLTL